MTRVRIFSLLSVSSFLFPSSLSGQTPHLAEAERLMTDGRFAEARTALEAWYEAEGEGADRIERQYAIWLRALLTTDPEEAELDYRRLVIEYPGGQYSDGALLRLAQGARAWGDLEATRRYLEILVRDYPLSPLRVEARTFLARLDQTPPLRGLVGAPASPGTPAGNPAPPGPASPVSEAPPSLPPPASPEGWVSGAGPTVGPVPAVDPPNSPIGPAPPAGEGIFTLQLGAFSTDARAAMVAGDARSAGIDVRIVKVEGSDLIRVRHGAFLTREEAEVGAQLLRSLGLEAVITSDRDREQGG